ncbi:MAG: TadE/TadG family type IV pilus assembly protein, partial [Beijerinckiaceae bacterium]
RKSENGVAALEFAIILPVIITMWLGTFEVTQAISISRRVTLVSRTIADLTSRAKAVTNTDVADIFGASKSVFAPVSTTDLKMILTSVKRATTNKVVWSRVPAGQTVPSAYAVNSEFTLPNDILATDGESVIVAEVTYTYKPISHWITTPASMDLRQTTYMIPRASAEVEMK